MKKNKKQRRQGEAAARQAAKVPRVDVSSVGQLIETLATQPRDAKVYGASDLFDRGDVCVHKGGKDLLHIFLTGF